MKRWSCGLILYMEELRLHIFAEMNVTEIMNDCE